MRLVVFAYDFPHRKTHDVLVRLRLLGIPVAMVIAAPWRTLAVHTELPRSRTRVDEFNVPYPRTVTKVLGTTLDVGYQVAPHEECAPILSRWGITHGVIAGARILPADVIDAVPGGILNLHPGPLPEIRGLDTLNKTILHDLEPAVTAHRIDDRIDVGSIVKVSRVPVYADDSIFDVGERLHQMELSMLKCLYLLETAKPADDVPRYWPRLSRREQMSALNLFHAWRARHAQ